MIKAIAPIRICDIGGWTDTWFAGHGAVFNMAVYPYVEVQVKRVTCTDESRPIALHVENFNQRYHLDPARITYDKHPLIEAAIDVMDLPRDQGLAINIHSDAPPGASTGTSAAVSVALIGALDRLTRGRLTPHEVAALAHSLEREKLGLQCGIQDQFCSAYGGMNFIRMPSFPHADISPVKIPDPLWWELESRLAVIYIGAPHSSSLIHKKVIKELGENPEKDERIEALRKLAQTARDAVHGGDLPALGRIMKENTEMQRRLHPDLVCSTFEEIIGIAEHYHVLGCKVNGAGGDGGSLTLLTDGDGTGKRKLLRELEDKGYSALPLYLSRQGLRVWTHS